ncbi:MAG TPA: hypothetical protein VK892_04555 [Pyrinomonadaceae bacterium]|nr:hypothetical protein [Pyrinomonadaceae bacterium]
MEEDPRNNEAKSDAADGYFAQSRIRLVFGERQNAVKSMENPSN